MGIPALEANTVTDSIIIFELIFKSIIFNKNILRKPKLVNLTNIILVQATYGSVYLPL